MNEVNWAVLLHDWVVRAEYDAGYVLLRCRICGEENLADPPRIEASGFTSQGGANASG